MPRCSMKQSTPELWDAAPVVNRAAERGQEGRQQLGQRLAVGGARAGGRVALQRLRSTTRCWRCRTLSLQGHLLRRLAHWPRPCSLTTHCRSFSTSHLAYCQCRCRPCTACAAASHSNPLPAQDARALMQRAAFSAYLLHLSTASTPDATSSAACPARARGTGAAGSARLEQPGRRLAAAVQRPLRHRILWQLKQRADGRQHRRLPRLQVKHRLASRRRSVSTAVFP